MSEQAGEETSWRAAAPTIRINHASMEKEFLVVDRNSFTPQTTPTYCELYVQTD